MNEKNNIINVSMCPGCHKLTSMKHMKGNKYFCKLCKQNFKQYKNGKLIYIPLTVADAVDKIKEQLLFEFEADPQMDINKDISFEPDYEDDFDKE